MESVGGMGVGQARNWGALATAWLVVLCGALLAGEGCGGGSSGGHPDAHSDAAPHDGRDGDASGPETGVDGGALDATCGHDGTTKLATSQVCSCDSDCTSGHCVDGVCCSTACNEACKTCSGTGSVGTCTFLVAGTKPRDATACKAADASTCGFDGVCDGAGACRRHVAGTICQPGTCAGDAVVGAFACDGAGRCKPGPTIICAPYSCDPTRGACYETCTQSSQCVSGQQCVGASCGKKMKGATCAANVDCASGFCADNVCCNVACQGGCVSCGLPGRLGTCWPTDQGAPDPRGACKDQGATSCGTTGTCDGFGGCEKYAAETQCIAPTCTGTRRNTPGTCDGSGTCRPQGVQNCSPFLCVGGACTVNCQSDADCESGHACVNHVCGLMNLGQPCADGTTCLSGQCIEGVCCDSACDGACRSCALSSSMGHCTSLAVGAVDTKGVCGDQGATTCGTNGRCDGSGGCQKYKESTVCAPESCAGNVYTPPSTCSATGQCTPPDSLPCAPYVCNGNACFNACTTNQDCVSPNVCNGNSCGPKMRGASCSDPTECGSGFCAQGVCCGNACSGACTSCNLSGSLGTCTNQPVGVPDQASLCPDQGGASCGTNGKCDGGGGCQKYVQGTPCHDSTCPAATTTFTPGASCDGAGACVTPPASSCFPFQCGGTVCKATCAADADCASPAVCVGGSCGLKGRGKTCADGTECASTFCAQGVCCDNACAGTCTSCALPSSLGMCTNVPVGGKDPGSRCADHGMSSCGTDGACDGAGACRLYAAGTACLAASCTTGMSTLTLVRTCDGAGTCKMASTQPCAPYLCNGVSACKAACTVDSDCLLPNICDPQTNLCGNKRRLGQTCAATSDCLTGSTCVDGVCCSSSACGLCQTCASGSCADVAVGKADPHGGCAAAPPCGNTGACNGAGACEQAAVSVACGSASCAGATFTPVSHCTGAGACAVPVPSGCSPYMCGGSACKTACAVDGDCVMPFTCQGSGGTLSCALKANGVACGSGAQCITGNCVDGSCCGSAHCGLCQTCASGACANVATGTPDLHGGCAAAPPCGNTGTCSGGACTQAGTAVTCGSPSCTLGVGSLVPHCTGAGACGPAPTTNCAPFVCGASACLATCAGDGDCLSPFTCHAGTCALKSDGLACGAATECLHGNCVDGSCCGTASCGLCQTCASGTCAAVGAGKPELHGGCAASPPCGNTGNCTAASQCEQAGTGVGCGTASCSGSTATLVSHCTGAGACATPATPSCSPFVCGASACKTTCSTDLDCLSPFTCHAGLCTLKPDGLACGAGTECLHGNCVDGSCCGTASCGLCQTCASGTCANLAPGKPELHGGCTANPPCGNTGTCSGGACEQAGTGVGCGTASCSGSTATLVSHCTGAGACATPATPSCSPFVCGASACKTTCSTDLDCLSPFTCHAGLCTLKPDGLACGAGTECLHGNCVDGSCCGTASCGLCQTCASGTCANLAPGKSELHGLCPVNPPCGNTGTCTSGACDQAGTGVSCGSASCSVATETATLVSHCTGGGACATAPTSACSPFVCGATACLAACTTDGDCLSPFTCQGTTCALKPDGQACGAGAECLDGNCIDGVCCGTASCGPCQACNLNGLGTCSNVDAGAADPHNRCASQPPSSCGTTGVCSGSGTCATYADGTPCASASCPAGGAGGVLESTCLGGTCPTQGSLDCAPYKCDGAVGCKGTCDGDCGAGYYCTAAIGGTCQPLANVSDPCTSDDQCSNGHCADGFCCNVPTGMTTCGGCQTCALPGSEGSCMPVPLGTPSGTFCTPADIATCGNTGNCDGGGGCELFDVHSVCLAASCTPGTSTLTLPSLCDGNGLCVTGAMSVCTSGMCSGDGSTCDGTACVFAGDCPSGTCQADLTCAP
jgi:hypothetical protein